MSVRPVQLAHAVVNFIPHAKALVTYMHVDNEKVCILLEQTFPQYLEAHVIMMKSSMKGDKEAAWYICNV